MLEQPTQPVRGQVRMRTPILGFAFLIAAGGAAGAEPATFDELAAEARPLPGPRAFAALFWSLTETCKGSGDDLERRQCEGVRAARAAEVTAGAWLVTATATVHAAGPYDEKKKSMPLVVEGCVVCGESAGEGGAGFHVLGQGRHRVTGGNIRAAELFESARTFEGAAAAADFRDTVLPRLQTDFVIRLPRRVESWRSGGASGYKVEILGYRVYDPCDGAVLFASPRSGAAPVDRAACREARAKAPKPAARPEPKGPALPEQLTTAQVRAAMKPIQALAQACFETHKVAGTARLHITFSGQGTVTSVELRDEFAGTPTGECLLEAARSARFPASQKPRMTISFPIILR